MMSLKDRFSLLSETLTALFEYICIEYRSFTRRIYRVYIKIFTTHSIRIKLQCLILLLLPVIFYLYTKFVAVNQDHNQNPYYDIIPNIIAILLLGAWIAFIVTGLFGRYQNNLISRLEAKPVDEQYANITTIVENHSQQAGISAPDIYFTDIPFVTAFSINPIKGKSIVIVNSKIITLLNEEEISCVIAHELCHIKHHDSILNTIILFTYFIALVILMEYGFLYSFKVIRNWIKGIKNSVPKSIIFISIGNLITGMFITFGLLSLFFAIPIRNIKHEQDLRADISSALMTKNPLALKNAIAKLESFVQIPDDLCCDYLLQYCIVEPLSSDWSRQKLLRFISPKNSSRMYLLNQLNEIQQEKVNE